MKLSAPPEYWSLTPEAKAEICNGCGPAGWKGMLIPDHLLGAVITEPCNIHDWRYATGQTEEDRLLGDLEFHTNMLIVVESERNDDNLLTEARRELALRYYATVRDSGKPFFWADKVPAGEVLV
jgi:hypothetical protein